MPMRAFPSTVRTNQNENPFSFSVSVSVRRATSPLKHQPQKCGWNNRVFFSQKKKSIQKFRKADHLGFATTGVFLSLSFCLHPFVEDCLGCSSFGTRPSRHSYKSMKLSNALLMMMSEPISSVRRGRQRQGGGFLLMTLSFLLLLFLPGFVHGEDGGITDSLTVKASPTTEGCCTYTYNSCIDPSGGCSELEACETCGGVWLETRPTDSSCTVIYGDCNGNRKDTCCLGLVCVTDQETDWSNCVPRTEETANPTRSSPTTPPTITPTATPTFGAPPTQTSEEEMPFTQVEDFLESLIVRGVLDLQILTPSRFKSSGLLQSLWIMHAYGIGAAVDDDDGDDNGDDDMDEFEEEYYFYLGDMREMDEEENNDSEDPGETTLFGSRDEEDDEYASYAYEYRYGLVNLAVFLSQLMAMDNFHSTHTCYYPGNWTIPPTTTDATEAPTPVSPTTTPVASPTNPPVSPTNAPVSPTNVPVNLPTVGRRQQRRRRRRGRRQRRRRTSSMDSEDEMSDFSFRSTNSTNTTNSTTTNNNSTTSATYDGGGGSDVVVGRSSPCGAMGLWPLCNASETTFCNAVDYPIASDRVCSCVLGQLNMKLGISAVDFSLAPRWAYYDDEVDFCNQTKIDEEKELCTYYESRYDEGTFLVPMASWIMNVQRYSSPTGWNYTGALRELVDNELDDEEKREFILRISSIIRTGSHVIIYDPQLRDPTEAYFDLVISLFRQVLPSVFETPLPPKKSAAAATTMTSSLGGGFVSGLLLLLSSLFIFGE